MCGKYYTTFPDELGGFLLFPCFLAFFILPWYVCQRYIIAYLFHNTKQMVEKGVMMMKIVTQYIRYQFYREHIIKKRISVNKY